MQRMSCTTCQTGSTTCTLCNPLSSLSSYLSYPVLSFLKLYYLNSSTHRFPQSPLTNLYSLVTLAVFSLIFAATDTAFYLLRIGRIENPSCSTCRHLSQDTSHLILQSLAIDSLCHLLFGDSLSLYNLWFRPWGVAQLLGLHHLPPHAHPSEGVG